MRVSFVIGNGNSRSKFDLNLLHGKGMTYGCNLLAHDHDLDNIIACDRHMVVDLCSQGFAEKCNLYTRQRWASMLADENIKSLSDPVKDPKHRYDREIHWNSGVHAINLAAEQGADIVVLLGFDLYPNKEGINNIYHDQSGYSNKPVDPSHWIYQISYLFKKFADTSFVQIQPESWVDPQEWKTFDNYSRDTYTGLKQWLREL